MNWQVFLFLATIIGFHSGLRAEYRVFVLQIENTQTQNIRTVKSTLDPEQYKTLYPVHPDEVVTYTNTWLCRGSTAGLQGLCEAPLSPEPDSKKVQN